MSLVIAKAHKGKIYIVGDTALTYHNNPGANPFVSGCLKQYRVNERLAVAFAGDTAGFRDACSDIFASTDSSEIIEVARKAQKKGHEFDLLVAEVGNDNITFLKAGVVSEGSSGFIGDSEAFGVFQKHSHSVAAGAVPHKDLAHLQHSFAQATEAEAEIYSRMLDSLRQVLLDPNCKTVGGAIVPLCTDKSLFRYRLHMESASDLLNLNDFSTTPKAIPFGTAEGGGFTMEFNDDSPNGGDGNEVGIYFPQGKFGIIFPADAVGFRAAELVKANSAPHWVLSTARRLGRGISSSFISPHACGIAGEELISAGDNEGALFCYSLGVNHMQQLPPPQTDRYIAGQSAALANLGKLDEAMDLLRAAISTNQEAKCCQKVLNQLVAPQPASSPDC